MKMLEDLAEVVRLFNEADSMDYGPGWADAWQCAKSAADDYLRTHHATIRDMAARLEAAERDAARYRWLRSKVAIIGKDGLLGQASDRYCVFEFCNLPFPTYIAPDPSIELDAAIDAAMQETGR